MSLQVWLPMNGDLKNYGFLDYNITSINSSVDIDGKIGSCMKINRYANMGYTPNFNTTSLTMGGWFKFNQAEIASVVSGLTYTNVAVSPTGNLLGNDSYGGIGLIWAGNNYYSSNSFNNIYVHGAIRTGTAGGINIPSFTVEFDKWVHIMLVWDISTRKLSLYKNGSLVGSQTIGVFSDGVSRMLVLNYKAIYGGNGPSAEIPFRCNDIRIYDNALSANEVKKIAQGLVLHYPLSDRFNEPTTNLLPKSLQNFSISNYDALSFTYNTSQHGKYTLSGFLTVQPTSDWVSPRITITGYYSDGTNITIAQNYKISKDGKEHFIETTGQTDTSKTLVAIKGWVLDHSSGGSHKDVVGRNFQLEFKDHSTPYTSSSRNNNILHDCSGYKNNGIISGTISCSSNTPRHNVSTFFADYTRTIQVPIVISSPDKFTMAVWVKSTSVGKGSYQMPLNIDAGLYEFSIDSNGKFRQGFYVNGTRNVTTTESKNVLDGSWHHLAATFDGSNIKRYVDGELVDTTAASGTLSTSSMLYVGTYGTGTSYGNVNMYESDIRLYVTALSADDIMELYTTPTYLANN